MGAHVQAQTWVKILKDGPYEVSGNIELFEAAIVPAAGGGHLEYGRMRALEPPGAPGQPYHLCRCGASGARPFCDGSHKHAGFAGMRSAEVAARTSYAARATEYLGPDLALFDDGRCAFARLCHMDGQDVWNLTVGTPREAGLDAATQRTRAVAASWNCPTGRLVHVDRHIGQAYEQEFSPSIVVLDDTQAGVGGPLFVRGGVTLVGADGFEYETRNRYALCRCGASADKPFCDAAHVTHDFPPDS
jgi:CDGSH-type Zn-finger protein